MPIKFYLKEQAPDYYSWLEPSGIFLREPIRKLEAFLKEGYETRHLVPQKMKLFRALQLCPLDKVRVVILGQDPHPDPYQADGLAFSSESGLPTNLLYIFKCLYTDLGVYRMKTDLSDWANQGVLLLNRHMTTDAGKVFAHSKEGWDILTDAIIRLVNAHQKQVAWCLWGEAARKKSMFIKDSRALIIESSYPSLTTAHEGFLEHRPFSRINAYLKQNRSEPIIF